MQNRRKTQTKAFRFDVSLLEGLKRAADNAGMTKNAFMSAVLADRLLIDALVRAFHKISLSDETFLSILGSADADAIEMAGSEMARKNFPMVCELYQRSGHPLAFREFLTQILGKHAGWFHAEDDGDGTQRWMTLTHPFGRKWSIFVKAYILSAYSTISKDKIKIEIADQFIRIDFRRHNDSQSGTNRVSYYPGDKVSSQRSENEKRASA